MLKLFIDIKVVVSGLKQLFHIQKGLFWYFKSILIFKQQSLLWNIIVHLKICKQPYKPQIYFFNTFRVMPTQK